MSSPSRNSDPISVDITTKFGEPVYTSGFAFHQNVLHYVTPQSHIRIMSYNVGINVGPEYLHDLVTKLGRAKKVQMLIGHNPYHMENIKIQMELQRYMQLAPTLEVRLQEKQHAKVVIIEEPITKINTLDAFFVHGWAGSLNFINPTLADVMVQLTFTQICDLRAHFDFQWTLGKPLSPVHTVNATTLCPPKTQTPQSSLISPTSTPDLKQVPLRHLFKPTLRNPPKK